MLQLGFPDQDINEQINNLLRAEVEDLNTLIANIPKLRAHGFDTIRPNFQDGFARIAEVLEELYEEGRFEDILSSNSTGIPMANNNGNTTGNPSANNNGGAMVRLEVLPGDDLAVVLNRPALVLGALQALGNPRVNNQRPAGNPRVNNQRPAGNPRANNQRPAGNPRANNQRPAGNPRANNQRQALGGNNQW